MGASYLELDMKYKCARLAVAEGRFVFEFGERQGYDLAWQRAGVRARFFAHTCYAVVAFVPGFRLRLELPTILLLLVVLAAITTLRIGVRRVPAAEPGCTVCNCGYYLYKGMRQCSECGQLCQ